MQPKQLRGVTSICAMITVTNMRLLSAVNFLLKLNSVPKGIGLAIALLLNIAAFSQNWSLNTPVVCAGNGVAVTLTATAGGNNQGGYRITLPAGFAIVSVPATVTASNNATWNVSTSGQNVCLTAQGNGGRISDPQFVSVTITVNTPVTGASGNLTGFATTNTTCPSSGGSLIGTPTITARALPTLTGTNSAATAVCTGNTVAITLSGLLANTAHTVNYTMGGTVGTQTVNITSNASGTAVFNTPALTAANSGQILTITGLTRTDATPNCTVVPVVGNTTLLPAVATAPSMPAAFTVSTSSVCQGQAGVVYTIPNDPGSTTYNWNYSGTGATINGTGNSVTLDFNNAATSGTLSVTATNTCATSVARTMNITVNAIQTPTVAITQTGGTNPACIGSAVSYTATASNTGGGAVNYTFKVDGITAQSSTSAVFTIATLTSGTHLITCDIAISEGTCLTSTTATTILGTGIDIKSSVIADAGADQIITGPTTTLSGNNPSPGTGIWTITGVPNDGNFVNNVVYNTTFTGTEGKTYTLRWTVTNAPCPATFDEVSITLNPAAISTTTTIEAATATYGDGNVNLVAHVSPTTATGAVEFYVDGSLKGTGSLSSGTALLSYDLTGTQAGYHNLQAKYLGAGVYTASESTVDPEITTRLLVNKKSASITPDPLSKTYGDADPAFTGTLSGFLAADGITASYSRGSGETVAGSSYTISATLAPTEALSNYEITYNTADFTITKKSASVTPNAASKIYGDSDPGFTGTLAGFLAADGITSSYNRVSGETVAGSPYAISATLLPTEVLSNYEISYNTADFTITKKSANVTPNQASKTYGDADPAFTGTLNGFLAADGITASYNRVSGETVAGSPYAISATLSPTEVLSNYEISYNTADFTITKKSASVTPNPASKIYGDADPAFTGTLSGFLAADGITASYNRVSGETVAGSPYAISATLSPTEVLSNYEITYNTADFTITKKSASVTPNAASKTYGDADPAFTGTLTGFLAADGITASYNRVSGETVLGSPYAISATLSPTEVLSNYDITYNIADFTITKKSASVTPNPASKIYGDVDPVLDGTLTGFLAADGITASYNRVSGETVAGSLYTISAILSPTEVLSNYEITYNTADFSITKKSASVTPNAASKIYGDADPVFTGTQTGFLAADGITASYSRVSGETVAGSPYAISAILSPIEVLSNYEITYNTADFTITKKSASVTPNAASKTYGDSDPAFTGTLTGFLAADGITAFYSRVSGETVAGSPYAISATLSPTEVLSNYEITYNTADFTITKKSASVTPNLASKTYGDADPVLDGTLTGFLTADGITASYGRVSGETVAGSPYAISAILSPTEVLSNYDITYGTTDFVINKRPASITANTKVKNYGDEVAFTGTEFTASGFVNGDVVNTVTLTSAGAVATATVAGSPYSIVPSAATGTGLSNYTISYNSGILTINRKELTATLIGIVTKIYDGTTTASLAAGNYNVTGVLFGDNVILNNPQAGVYANKHVGINKVVSVSGLTISGSAAGNYQLVSTTAGAAIGNITARTVNVTAQPATKLYDGTTSSTIVPVVDALQSGDILGTAPSQTYDTKHMGTGKTLTPGGLSIADGNNGNNYSINYVKNFNGVINKRSINLTAQAAIKVYDGNTSSVVLPIVAPLQTGDVIGTAPIQTYDTKHVGTGKTVTPSGLVINDGNGGNNYTIVAVTNTNGVITKKSVKVTAQQATKMYDGNISSAVVPVVDALPSGDVILTNAAQTYNTPVVGTGKILAASGLVINDGNDGNNYDISYFTNNTGVITALPVNASVVTNVSSTQYSDLVSFTATLAGGALSGSGGPQAAQSVTFKVGSQTLGTVSMTVDPANPANLIAVLSNVQMVEPSPFGTLPTGQMAPGLKNVYAVFNSPDANFSLSNNPATSSITITKEDAWVEYTGDVIEATATASATTATITLRANIFDITAADAATDGNAGDIRNAKVMFVNRDAANAPLSGWIPVTTLVNAADSKVGTVSYNWAVNLGSQDAISVTVGIIVNENGYYSRDAAADNIVVTVYKPDGDFITGGGYIINTNSVGQMKADVGSKANFGFNVKFNKKGKNLQGNLNFIFRRTETDGKVHIYQVKANAMQSLGVNATNAQRQTANFVSKANITDVTNPAAPIAMGGNKYVYVDMIDNGEPGHKDSISFVLVEGDVNPTVLGNIIYSSNWVSTKTVMKNLSGGNLVVHSGFNFNSTARLLSTPEIEERALAIKVYPNPTTIQFTIQLQGNEQLGTVQLRVVDISGRTMQIFDGLSANETIRLGNGYDQGIYFVEVIQGDRRKQLKLIKQK